MAGHDRADDERLDARRVHGLELVHMGDVLARGQQHLAVDARHVVEQAAADEVLVDVALLVVQRVRHAVGGAAVDLADDDVLGHVHQTAGQVARVGGTQRGVGQTLTGAVRGDEVLQNGQALAEVRLDRAVDDLALRVGHEASHTGQLADLLDVASSAGERHHVDGVELVEVLGHGLADFFVRGVPDVDDLLVALVGAHEAHLVVLVDGRDLLVGGSQDLGLVRRHGGVVHRNGDAGTRGVVEARVLEAVEDRRHAGQLVAVAHVLDEAADLLLVHLVVEVRIVLGQHVVERDAADGGLDALARLVLLEHAEGRGHLRVLGQTHPDLGLQVKLGARVVGVHGVVEVDERATLALEAVAGGREVVQADDHVLGGHGQRTAMGRRLDVVGGQHEHAGLGLRLGAQRHVHGHLVAVEVGVEGGADQRVQLDGLALDQHRLEGLDAQTVQGRCAVQQHGMLGDDLFQHVPHVAGAAVDGALGGLDVGGVLQLHQALHDEGLEQLQRHLRRQAALVQLELRADDDDRTTGVVDALAQQVLAEAALLALEHVGQALERAVVGAGHRTAAAAVVDEGVHRLLQHTLFVAHNDIWSAQLQQTLQTVVAVDDAAVQVVQVGRGKTSAVQLDHRADIGRNDRDDVHDHPLRTVAGDAERLHDFQPLEQAHALLAACFLQFLMQLFAELFQVDLLQQLLHGLCAHCRLELVLVALTHVAVLFFAEQLLFLQRCEAGIGHDICGKVQHLFQQARADIQHQADAGRDPLEIPDMRNGRGQLDMAHTLAAHLGARHFNAAAVADLTLVADALVLAAVAFPVLRRPKNALTEQAVALRFQGAVVDGLGLFHLAVAPGTDLIRGGKTDLD